MNEFCFLINENIGGGYMEVYRVLFKVIGKGFINWKYGKVIF